MPQTDRSLDTAILNRTHLRDQLVAAWPELMDDTDTLLDTLSGIDNFEEQIVAIMRQVAEREAHAKAMGELIDGMWARKQRLENGAKWLRAAVLHAMQEAGVPRIKSPDMSLSVSPGKPKLVIVDEAAVPPEFLRVKTEPDKKAIAEWLSNLTPFDAPPPAWCAWVNPQPYLAVHRK